MKLGEWVGLCKIDQEGQARKVVKCSCAVVKNWGAQGPARDVVQVFNSLYVVVVFMLTLIVVTHV